MPLVLWPGSVTVIIIARSATIGEKRLFRRMEYGSFVNTDFAFAIGGKCQHYCTDLVPPTATFTATC